MDRPRVTCHMATSLDGRLLPGRWTPKGAHSHDLYDELHARLGGGSWMVGRVTGQEFAKRDSYPTGTNGIFPREPWLPRTDAQAYAIVVDAHGKIAWGFADVGGDPIVVILTEAVSDDHLAGLRSEGIGYLFAGERELDLATAVLSLRSELGLEHLLLEGGGRINGEMLRAGLIDELSIMLVPAIDGALGSPALFDAAEGAPRVAPPVEDITLESHEVLDKGIVWLRYHVRGDV